METFLSFLIATGVTWFFVRRYMKAEAEKAVRIRSRAAAVKR